MIANQRWSNLLFSGFAGLLFGLGLVVSGMASPAKVIGFLDLTQAWDPSLAFVMVGAIAVGLPGFRWVTTMRKTSLLGEPLRLPEASRPDIRLLLGALLFGLGWGMGGFCPGPALVAAGSLATDGLVFAAAMLAGMFAFSVRPG